jgi:DNA replication protein DnaC
MTHPHRLRLGEHFRHLKLLQIQVRLETLRHEASAQALPSADFLDRLLTEEGSAKEETPLTMHTVRARFPACKTLESLDCGCQSSVDLKKGRELATGRFIEHGDTVVFLGPPGTGKTSLAIALGLKAVQSRYRTRFTSAMGLITALTNATAKNRLEERLKPYRLHTLLSIDEIGSIPIDQPGAHLFFPLIARRYECGFLVLTSHQSFGQWGEVFGHPIIATAILDRLLHQRVAIKSKGESSRLRAKQQAGLLEKPEPSLVS